MLHTVFNHDFSKFDNRASSAWTCKQLGRRPAQLRLLEDLDQPYYFAGWRQ